MQSGVFWGVHKSYDSLLNLPPGVADKRRFTLMFGPKATTVDLFPLTCSPAPFCASMATKVIECVPATRNKMNPDNDKRKNMSLID